MNSILHARVAERSIYYLSTDGLKLKRDLLVVEEPLEIRVSFVKDGKKHLDHLVVVMRTPGADEELTIGFMFAEGIIDGLEKVEGLRENSTGNRNKPYSAAITVELSLDAHYNPQPQERRFIVTSSCGVCGKATLPAISNPKRNRASLEVEPAIIWELSGLQRQSQTVFQHTGGLHAVSLFERTGQLVKTYEDIGRHNAMDKLIGYGLKKDLLPFSNHILFFSGRVGYELMQKATASGAAVVASVGAPSSIAVQIADANDITLIGFVRESTFNVYTGTHRIAQVHSRSVNPVGPNHDSALRAQRENI